MVALYNTPPGPREAIQTALLALIRSMTFNSPINGQTTWVTADDRLRLWTDVPSPEQPACFLVTHHEQYDERGSGLPRRRPTYQAWCYSRTDDPAARGSTDLNTMMEAFDIAFTPEPIQLFLTLGGITYWARIEGRIFKDPGDIDNQTLLILPIVVQMP